MCGIYKTKLDMRCLTGGADVGLIPTSSEPLNMRGAKMMASLTWMTCPAKFWLELRGGRPTMKLLSVAVVVSPKSQ